MTDAAPNPRYLEIFPSWLRTLGEDAGQLGDVVAQQSQSGAPSPGIRYLVAGLTYIFKSLDLIPDGIDDLGYMDDAFVLRLAADFAASEDASLKEGIVLRLADESRQVKEFLGDDYARLEVYVKGLRKGAARGRTVDDVLEDASTRTGFLQEVSAWSKDYQVPAFTRDVKTLIKLKAFLSAKLA